MLQSHWPRGVEMRIELPHHSDGCQVVFVSWSHSFPEIEAKNSELIVSSAPVFGHDLSIARSCRVSPLKKFSRDHKPIRVVGQKIAQIP